jgi:hypothetical protein
MKIVKVAAKIIGLIWMVLYGLGSILSIIQKPINLSTPDGIGVFLGALVAHIVIFSIGFFLFRWGDSKLRQKKLKGEKLGAKKESVNGQENGVNHGSEKGEIKPFNAKNTSGNIKPKTPISIKPLIIQSNDLGNELQNDKEVQPSRLEEVFKQIDTVEQSAFEQLKVKLIEVKGVNTFPVSINPSANLNDPTLEKENVIEKFLSQADYLTMGYQPNSAWLQKETKKCFPYVNMPMAGTRVLLPQPGKLKSAGVSEADFKILLLESFGNKVLSQHFLVFEGARHDYEPDFIFKEVSKGLLIDIEIDEPYSGRSRKPMHYLNCSDVDRDHYFNKSGWVVIRFAEEQVVRNPYGCIKYIAGVIDSLIQTNYSKSIGDTPDLNTVRKWTFDEAVAMADSFYREQYLGIKFDSVPDSIVEIETELHVVKENRSPYGYIDITHRDTSISDIEGIHQNIIDQLELIKAQGKYCSFNYANETAHIVKLIRLFFERSVHKMTCYDYIKNQDLEFETRLIANIKTFESPFLYDSVIGGGNDNLNRSLETAMNNMLFVRFEYTNYDGDDSLRTLGPLDYTDEFNARGYHKDHISGYCHKRDENRNFRIQRIRQLWILNVGFE